MPEFCKQWQERAGREGRYFVIPTDQNVRRDVLQALKQALWASGPEYVATSLLRLQAHYWRPDFTQAQARELYADYIEDLAELPPDLLDEAIRRYRRDPSAKFFPRSGDLLGLINVDWQTRRRAVINLEMPDIARSDHRERTPEEIARVRKLVQETFNLPPDEIGA